MFFLYFGLCLYASFLITRITSLLQKPLKWSLLVLVIAYFVVSSVSFACIGSCNKQDSDSKLLLQVPHNHFAIWCFQRKKKETKTRKNKSEDVNWCKKKGDYYYKKKTWNAISSFLFCEFLVFEKRKRIIPSILLLSSLQGFLHLNS